MTIEELFGTLQMSVVAGWRKHLRTAKYGKHKALQEFYEEMPDKVDALIEGWMGAHGKKIGNFQNVLSSSNLNTLKYLGELKAVCKQGYSLIGDNDELKSLLDDIVNLINSTLYKVKELSESSMIDLVDFINESLAVNEGKYDNMHDELLVYDNQLVFKKYFADCAKKDGYTNLAKMKIQPFSFDDVDCYDINTSSNIDGIKADGSLTFENAYKMLIDYLQNSKDWKNKF